jgi:hypothetical protein
MRVNGVPVRRIAKTLGVSISSVSIWTRDIELTAEQRAANLSRAEARRGPAWSEKNRERRRGFQQGGRARARFAEPLHVAGCMLYWAEGTKGRNAARFSNSDPAMCALFCRFMRECFGVTSDRLTFSINAYTNNGRTIDEIESYWLDVLGLSRSSARKHMINHFPTSSSGRKSNRLPNGVCTIRVTKSTPIVQHIYGAIQEYAGIDVPEWLDGPPRKTPAAAKEIPAN